MTTQSFTFQAMIRKLTTLLKRYREWQTPTHVERASRREQWKRQAWIVASTVLSFALVLLPLVALIELTPVTIPVGIEGVVFAVAATIVAFGIDIYLVFPWGFERFDLVAPWQFRDAEKEA